MYTLSVADLRLVAGLGGRQVMVYDLRNLSQPEQVRESSLQHQTRVIRSFPDNSGFALGSVEGRVALEYFDPRPEVQAKKFAFKCHRATVGGVDYVYPVNAIAFHRQQGTFATGGCDGMVNIWDGEARKRLCQYHRYPTSIAALAFNHSGTKLAIASSYTFEEGDRVHPPDEVFVRNVQDSDVRSKVPRMQ